MKQFRDRSGVRPLVRAFSLVTVMSTVLLASCGGGGDDVGSGGGGSTNPPVPTLSLNANAAPNGTVNLVWSSANATSCTASGAWSGSKSPTGNQSITGVTPGAATFSLECAGAGGTVSRSATVTVEASPPALTLTANPEIVALGSSFVLSWTASNVTSCTASGGWAGTKAATGAENIAAASVGAVDYTLTCVGTGGSVTRNVSVTVNPGAQATLGLIATPTSVPVGAAFLLEWVSDNVASCTASGAWGGSRPTSGNATFVSEAAGTFTFNLTCTGAGGSVSQSVVVTVTPPTPTGNPYITVTITGFSPFANVPGYLPADKNALVYVDVWKEDLTAPVSTATVSINGTSLPYDGSIKAYARQMTVLPGEMITASIAVDGTTYEASTRQFDTYPSIQTPLDDMAWTNSIQNEIRWYGSSSRPGAQVMLKMIGATPQQDWPSGGWANAGSSANSHQVPANVLSASNYLLLVGYVDVATFPGAKAGSAFLLGGFDHRIISVRNPPVTPNVTGLTFKTQPPVAVGVGGTKQMAVEARVNCCTYSDWTTEASWSSSNSSVLTVNGAGLVSGVSAGTANVTASYNGVSVSMPVRVYQAPAPLPGGPPSTSTAFQVDHTHAGHLTLGGPPALPLTNRWTASFDGRVSYPVVADGRVFVITDRIVPPNGVLGTSIHALDVNTGATLWGPVHHSSNLRWAAHTYANGKLFVITGSGLLRALDAATGEELWAEQMPGNMGYSAPPVAVNGLVYLSYGGGLMIAVHQEDGTKLWTASVANGMSSSPAVGSDGIYVSYACDNYKLDPFSGDTLWRYRGRCASGGGGTTPVLSGNAVLAGETGPDGGFRAFNVQDGAIVGDFRTSTRPAVANGMAYSVSNGVLKAVDMATNETLWSFTADPALVATPLVIDSMVAVAASTGAVYLIDAATGNPVWNGMAGSGVIPATEGLAGVPTGLGAGGGYLLVPGGNTLTGWKMVP